MPLHKILRRAQEKVRVPFDYSHLGLVVNLVLIGLYVTVESGDQLFNLVWKISHTIRV